MAPGASLPGAGDAARRGYFVWRARNPASAAAIDAAGLGDVVGPLWHAAWTDGGWDAIHRTSQLAHLTTRLEELIALYRTVEIERELEAGSALWTTK